MKILFISGYAAWNKVSKKQMPSHHMYGINEWIDHYEQEDGKLHGILKKDVFDGGVVDFYLWKPGKENILRQVKLLLHLGKNYDLVYDILNRCSIYLGFFKKLGLFHTKLVTIMHHPPYKLQLMMADSDVYIFFNDDYRKMAISYYKKKENIYFVNEWYPDIRWYKGVLASLQTLDVDDVFFVDNGKSKRDRTVLIDAANVAQITVDYAGTDQVGAENIEAFAHPYEIDLKDDVGMVARLKTYKAIIIPVMKNKKVKIGPLGITSFLDCIALGLPVIASDNVCFAREIEENGLGLTYKNGEKDDLASKMRVLYKDGEFYKQCRLNLDNYGENHTVFKYSMELHKIFQKAVLKDFR
ncbi:MAG: hypothetical protein P4L69_23470 [Desulfosporosinus sp.]|nr:hypothetical protein [Desulfosporosinus sp.]